MVTSSEVSFFILILYSLLFYVAQWILAFTPTTIIPNGNKYQNLHPIEYPPASSDLSLRIFQTPGLPMRLASTWEIQNELKIPKDALTPTYTMVYPLMERTQDMNRLLSQQATAAGKPYCAGCEAQKAFKIDNALQESQKQQFCPRRGEKESDWLSRTEYTKQDNDKNTKFTFNSEHAEFCRTARLPSMALAHVATNSYSIFSSQNVVMLLFYFATVNVLFGSSIAIYKAWGMHLTKPGTTVEEKLKSAGMYSALFLVVIILIIIPIMSEYIHRTDTMRSLGSLVVGLWTVIFSFVYIYVIPKMKTKMEPESSDEKGMSGISDRIVKDPVIIRYFVSRQPMISLVYWNFMQAPCIVLAVITRNSYIIDVYMQFIIFGTIAIGVLDIIQVRVNMIIGLKRRVKAKKEEIQNTQPTSVDVVVFITFLVTKLTISIPMLIKIIQMNVPAVGILAIILVLYAHTIHSLLALVVRLRRKETKPDENKLDTNDTWFNMSLSWQMVVSAIVFILALSTNATNP